MAGHQFGSQSIISEITGNQAKPYSSLKRDNGFTAEK
jgi:hypothetical protein